MEIIEEKPIFVQTLGMNYTTIKCCVCGVVFNPGHLKSNICMNCITSQSDVTLGITKQGILNFCRNCRRYNKPPWITCERESKEMLSMCLKKIKGLNRVKLIDAAFVWTESHSRRIKVKLTIQKEVAINTNIQQSFITEFEEFYQQCEDCQKEFTPHTWNGLVQVRQKADHKKTFFFLEQVILKHNAHDKCIKVKEEDEGIDFYFKNKSNALRLLDFLQTLIMTKVKQSKQLVSQDYNSNTYNYKYVFSVEIPKICKDDLVAIPSKLCVALGGCSPVLLCSKISNVITLIDPLTGKQIEMNEAQYFQYENEINMIPLKGHTTEFMILNVEQEKDKKSINSSIGGYKYKSSTIEVARVADWKTFTVKSHLGEFLEHGVSVLGYDLTTMNIFLEAGYENKDLPDIILVKRFYPNRKKRIWKLRRMDIEEIDEKNIHKRNNKAKEQHFEEFLEDVENDPEMRQKMNLYKEENNIKGKKNRKAKPTKQNANRKILKIKHKNDENKPEAAKKISEKEEIKENDAENNEDWIEDSDNEDNPNPNQVKLEELLDDLRINDEDDVDTAKENENLVEDFIKKIDNITISKE